jgi:hypothetical protein
LFPRGSRSAPATFFPNSMSYRSPHPQTRRRPTPSCSSWTLFSRPLRRPSPPVDSSMPVRAKPYRNVKIPRFSRYTNGCSRDSVILIKQGQCFEPTIFINQLLSTATQRLDGGGHGPSPKRLFPTAVEPPLAATSGSSAAALRP